MDQAQSTIARTTPLTASFTLAAYLALSIQTTLVAHQSSTKTLGLG